MNENTEFETVDLIIDPDYARANWQITARESGQKFEASVLNAIGKVTTIKIHRSNTGYLFQYNGHTAFLLDIDDAGQVTYRVQPEIDSFDLSIPQKIIFKTRTVLFKRPAKLDKNVTVGIDRDFYDQYDQNGKGAYKMKILEGARLFISGEKVMDTSRVTGSNFFKLLPSGAIQKIIIVRSGSIEGGSDDIPVSDAFITNRVKVTNSKKRNPKIQVNLMFWNGE